MQKNALEASGKQRVLVETGSHAGTQLHNQYSARQTGRSRFVGCKSGGLWTTAKNECFLLREGSRRPTVRAADCRCMPHTGIGETW